MRNIKDLPEPHRLAAIALEIGRPVPPNLTGEQYLKSRIHSFIFIGFLALCGAASTVALKAGYDIYQKMVRSDNLTRQILSNPSSDYMSAVNVLATGRGLVILAESRIKPTQSDAAIQALVATLAQARRPAGEINQRLSELAGTDYLNKVNATLSNSADRLNTYYNEIADCFRQVQCLPGFEASTLCNALSGITTSISAINTQARSIAGVYYNSGEPQSGVGGGSMDINFNEVSSKNIHLLFVSAC